MNFKRIYAYLYFVYSAFYYVSTNFYCSFYCKWYVKRKRRLEKPGERETRSWRTKHGGEVATIGKNKNSNPFMCCVFILYITLDIKEKPMFRVLVKMGKKEKIENPTK